MKFRIQLNIFDGLSFRNAYTHMCMCCILKLRRWIIMKHGFNMQISLCRSYELMERILKVYVYKEGERPIFHTSILKGLYASEGWFLKLMESNKQYVVKDPKKAHLFYLPFSARLLQFSFLKRGLTKQNMTAYLHKYVDMISTKYPFWNRTGGTDHFLAACHDWVCFYTANSFSRMWPCLFLTSFF